MRHLTGLAAAALFLAGCTLNSNRALPSGAAPASGRAVLVYGVAVNAPQPGPQFQLDMVAYDMATQKIDGNCFFFNRTEAVMEATSGAVHYVAFDVVPGHYTLTPFLQTADGESASAFAVPAGATVYVGDFTYTPPAPASLAPGRVSLAPARAASIGALRQALPGLRPLITIAAPLAVARPRPFMCTF